jgi:hypothetical protein
VRRQIIHQDNIASVQSREQSLGNVHLEGVAVHRSLQQRRGPQTLQSQGCKERIVRARITWRRFHDPLPWSSSSKQARHAEIDPAFIEEW